MAVVPPADSALVLDHPVLLAYDDLAAREAAANVKAGTPIIFSPDYQFDRVLARYFNMAPAFRSLNAATKTEEGRSIKGWLAYLDSRHIDWRDATPQHFEEWRDFRIDRPTIQAMIDAGDLPGVRDPRDVLVTTGTFAKAHFALGRLYAWAEREGHLRGASPIPEKVINPKARDDGAGKSNWLLPRQFFLWREVGLAGRQLVVDEAGALTWGEHDGSWKGGVNASRNVAYANLMISTALRRREQGTLLLPELPTEGDDARLAQATAKFGRGRAFTPNAEVLRQVNTYVRVMRAAAVRRAQKAGRYDSEHRGGRCLVVTSLTRRRGTWNYEVERGTGGTFEAADEILRQRLYRRDGEGRLEPLALWLADDGMPMRSASWNTVFRTANRRVACEYARLERSEEPPHVNPHVLRFTFALYLLAALHRQADARDGRGEMAAYDKNNYGLAYDVVRDLLGHKNRATTEDIYLAPVQGLRRAALFSSAVQMDLSEVIGMLVVDTDRVQGMSQAPGAGRPQ